MTNDLHSLTAKTDRELTETRAVRPAWHRPELSRMSLHETLGTGGSHTEGTSTNKVAG